MPEGHTLYVGGFRASVWPRGSPRPVLPLLSLLGDQRPISQLHRERLHSLVPAVPAVKGLVGAEVNGA